MQVLQQGFYHVNGYQKTSSIPEHLCAFRELDRCISEANEYLNRKNRRRRGFYVTVIASTGKLVYDSRNPEQRQAERCPVCRFDLDKSQERIEAHGHVFNSLGCLIAFEADKAVEL